MLVLVIFVCFAETDCGKSLLEKRHVIAAAAEAIEAIDQPRLHVRQVETDAIADEARPVPRRSFAGAFRVRREDADGAVVDVALAANHAADDVVRDHSLHVPLFRRRFFRESARAEESLLFALDGDEHHRRFERMLRQDARELHDHRDARGIVVRAGRIERRVHHVGVDRVVVAGGDVDAIGIAGAADRGHHINHFDGHVLRPRPLLHRRLVRDRHPPIAGRCDAGELVENPAPRRADAARFRGRVGERVPRPERDELVDRLLHPRGIELPDDAGNVGALRVQGDCDEEGGGRDEDSAHRAIVSLTYSSSTAGGNGGISLPTASRTGGSSSWMIVQIWTLSTA